MHSKLFSLVLTAAILTAPLSFAGEPEEKRSLLRTAAGAALLIAGLKLDPQEDCRTIPLDDRRNPDGSIRNVSETCSASAVRSIGRAFLITGGLSLGTILSGVPVSASVGPRYAYVEVSISLGE